MSLPASVQKLVNAIDAGNVSVEEVPTAIRQAGGADFVLISVIRELAAGGGGGGATWGGITGTLSAQLDLQAALDLKAGLTANTFTRKQTITQGTVNEGILASTGYNLTGSNASNMLDFAGTWNTSGNPTALKVNITNTASGASALLADFQIGAASVLSLSKIGIVKINGVQALYCAGAGQGLYIGDPGEGASLIIQQGGQTVIDSGILRLSSDAYLYRNTASTVSVMYGSSAMSFRVYGDGTKYASLSHDGTNAKVNASSGDLHISSLPTSNPGPGILWNNLGVPAIGT